MGQSKSIPFKETSSLIDIPVGDPVVAIIAEYPYVVIGTIRGAVVKYNIHTNTKKVLAEYSSSGIRCFHIEKHRLFALIGNTHCATWLLQTDENIELRRVLPFGDEEYLCLNCKSNFAIFRVGQTTQYNFLTNERIECDFVLNLTGRLVPVDFEDTLTLVLEHVKNKLGQLTVYNIQSGEIIGYANVPLGCKTYTHAKFLSKPTVIAVADSRILVLANYQTSKLVFITKPLGEDIIHIVTDEYSYVVVITVFAKLIKFSLIDGTMLQEFRLENISFFLDYPYCATLKDDYIYFSSDKSLSSVCISDMSQKN